jgi:hypothetical protein
LVPLLIATAENVDTEPPWSIPQLRGALAELITNHESLYLVVDGVAVTNLSLYRAPAPVFSLNFTNADNFYSIWYGRPFLGRVDPMLADGYWVMLEPLTPGPHVIRYGGKWRQPAFFQDFDFTAYITVESQFSSIARQPDGRMRMRFNGIPNQAYVFLASSNLIHWTPLLTNATAASAFELEDAAASFSAYRFYRAKQWP